VCSLTFAFSLLCCVCADRADYLNLVREVPGISRPTTAVRSRLLEKSEKRLMPQKLTGIVVKFAKFGQI